MLDLLTKACMLHLLPPPIPDWGFGIKWRARHDVLSPQARVDHLRLLDSPPPQTCLSLAC